jgi:hypothetical protein
VRDSAALYETFYAVGILDPASFDLDAPNLSDVHDHGQPYRRGIQIVGQNISAAIQQQFDDPASNAALRACD